MNDATPKIAGNESKPWWLAGDTVPAIATGTERGLWEFSSGANSTEFSTLRDVMCWDRVLTGDEVAHVYDANTDGKRCDCPLCAEGRRGVSVSDNIHTR